MRLILAEQAGLDVIEMVTPTRTDTGWVFPPLHVGVVAAPGWLIHVERATAAVLARYREDQSINRRVLGFWRYRSLALGLSPTSLQCITRGHADA